MNKTVPQRWAGIGARIREARTSAGFSQEAFAAKIGTSRRHVMRLERGEHRPGRSMLHRIAKATGQEPRWIDPDAEEDHQLVSVLLELLRVHVRELVRTELATAAKDGYVG